VRGLIAELGTLQPDDITVLDMEASIEHLSRGTLRNVDTLLLVTEPYYRSLETLGRMAPLAAELGLARRPVIANKVRTDRDLAAIGEYCARLGLDLIGSVPFDETVTEADHQGRSLIDHAPATAAVLAIDQIVGELLNAQPAAAPKQNK
jgi:CO dehydrogenase maturation factor